MTGKANLRAWLLCLPLVLFAMDWALAGDNTSAQSPTVEPQPRVVYQNLNDGDILQQPAFGIQLCFASPLNIKDLDKGGDFAFSITEPDGFGLGSRDVFQRDGYGVVVLPGNPVGATAGRWKFHYRVTSPDAKSALEGDINYTVDPNGSPFPQETPPVCVESGGTATPAPVSAESPTSTTIAGPIGSGSGGNSNDTLTYVLIAIGAAGAALTAVVLFVFRRRQGRATRRPTPGPATPIATSTPAHAAPRPRFETETPLPQSSPPPSSALPPPPVEAVTPLPQSSPPPSFTLPPPPVVESETALPESSAPAAPATLTEDSVVGKRADHRPDNSRYALLAIAAAAMLLIGLFIRRRGGRDRRRGRPGGDDGDRR